MAVHLDSRALILGECGHWWQVDSPPGAIAACPGCAALEGLPVLVDFTELATWGEVDRDCNCDYECDCDDEILEASRSAAAEIANHIRSRVKLLVSMDPQDQIVEAVLDIIEQAKYDLI